MKLEENQKQEVNNLVLNLIKENKNELSALDDYWHGITTSDGTVLDVNLFESKCVVYAVDDDNNIDTENYSLELYDNYKF